MNAQELKEKVQIETVRGTDKVKITAKIEAGAWIEVGLMAYATMHPEQLDALKERLKETAVREIYEDRRPALYKACEILKITSPYDFMTWRAAIDEILSIAASI